MSLSTPFIHRPIATMLLTLGLALVGAVSYFLLPVAPLPQVDYPTISVTASLPGAARCACRPTSWLALSTCAASRRPTWPQTSSQRSKIAGSAMR